MNPPRAMAKPSSTVHPPARPRRVARAVILVLVALAVVTVGGLVRPTPAAAQTAPPIEAPQPPATPTPSLPEAPTPPTATRTDGATDGTLDINLNTGEKPSKSIVIILVLTVLSIAPALLVMLTPF